MTPEQASDSLVKRITIMAEFIAENYPEQFDAFWKMTWPKPESVSSQDVLQFFSQPGLHEHYMLGVKVRIIL